MARSPFCLLVCALLVLAPGCGLAQIVVPTWMRGALQAQTLLSADTDVSTLALCGANDVFNRLAYTPTAWRDARANIALGKDTACVLGRCLKGQTQIHSQDFAVQDLLSAGMRRLVVNLHYSSLFGSSGYRLCRSDSHFFTGCRTLQQQLGNFDVCSQVLGVPTLDAVTTGCTVSSVTMEIGMGIISTWISDNAANLTYDVIVIDATDFITPAIKVFPLKVSDAKVHILRVMETTIGKHALTVDDLANFRSGAGVASTAWPTPKQMVDTYKKRVVILSARDSLVLNKYVHARPSNLSTVNNQATSVKNFISNGYLDNCPASAAPFQPVFESRKILTLSEVDVAGKFIQSVSNENGPIEFGTIDGVNANTILGCGLSPSLDLLDFDRISESCIWTYKSNVQTPGPGSGVQVVFNADDGWTTVNSSMSSTLRKACRNTDSATTWVLSSPNQACPAMYTFAIPTSPVQAHHLRMALAQANVTTVLLPSNVPGVTTPQKGNTTTPDSGSGASRDTPSGLLPAAVLLVLSLLGLTAV